MNPRYKPSGIVPVSMIANDIKGPEHKSVQQQIEEFFASDGEIQHVPTATCVKDIDPRNFVIKTETNVRVKACS
jgi:hypothetical protein